jgi:hypothetical protein
MVIGFAFEKSWLCPIKSGGFEKSEPPLFSVLAATGGCRHAIANR